MKGAGGADLEFLEPVLMGQVINNWRAEPALHGLLQVQAEGGMRFAFPPYVFYVFFRIGGQSPPYITSG